MSFGMELIWRLLLHPTGMEIYELYSLSTAVSTSKLAPDWLHKSEQPIRSQVSKLTQLLTMTQTHKFPLQAHVGDKGWSRLAIAQGAEDVGLVSVVSGLFPRYRSLYQTSSNVPYNLNCSPTR